MQKNRKKPFIRILDERLDRCYSADIGLIILALKTKLKNKENSGIWKEPAVVVFHIFNRIFNKHPSKWKLSVHLTNKSRAKTRTFVLCLLIISYFHIFHQVFNMLPLTGWKLYPFIKTQ